MTGATGPVAFVGAGNMAEALLQGWLKAGLLVPDAIRAAEIVAERRSYIAREYGISVTAEIAEAVAGAALVVLAVKPQQIAAVLPPVREALASDALVLSIVTGVTIADLENALGPVAIVRAMPNTPCMVGASATGLSAGRQVRAEQQALVLQLFRAVGSAFILPEYLLDAVTGLSGSGPAYIYLIIEALAAGGVYAGLPNDVALALAAQTVAGAAAMVLQTGEHPAVLRDKVTSPAGTTSRGLRALEEAGVRAALSGAVLAASRRAQELRQAGGGIPAPQSTREGT